MKVKHIVLALAAGAFAAALAVAQGDQETSQEQKMVDQSQKMVSDYAPAPPPGYTDESYMKPGDDVLKQKLTREQYVVTQQNGTEPPFQNEYWNNHAEGIYVDVVSGEPLFSSKEKYESGTGWPSFYEPLEPGNIVTVTDQSYGMTRTEVRSLFADSHLGHVFNDGPRPTGLRYCMNSASLRFIPVADLEKEGYGKYLGLFQDKQ